MKRTVSLILTLILAFTTLGTAALAASEVDTAAAYLKEQGIMTGDQNGNLNLDQSLTRAELAVILTRLDYLCTPGGLAEWDDWGKAYFSNPTNRLNTFTDLPDWAAPFIEYCYQRSLMVGVGDNRFDPQSKVNPEMAATVMLRFCSIRDTDWTYQTSVTKAQSIGLAPSDGMDGAAVLRGTMAVIIYRGIQYTETGTMPSEPTVPAPDTSSPPQVTPPADETVGMTIEEMKAEIVRLTNIERVKAGAPEVEALSELMDCAQAKADDFIESNYFSHISPVYGTPTEMVKSFVPNAKSVGENNAAWTTGAESVIYGFVNSPTHYATMIDSKFTHIGIGIVGDEESGYWCVQQFVKLD